LLKGGDYGYSHPEQTKIAEEAWCLALLMALERVPSDIRKAVELPGWLI